MDADRVMRLVDGQTRARLELERRAEAAVLRIVAGFEGWYDRSQITDMAAQVTAIVEAGQRQVATVTDAYLSRIASETAGRTITPVGAINPEQLRQGTSHAAVYGRLSNEYRFRESEGAAGDALLGFVTARARVMLDTDMQLALRAQSRRFGMRTGATGQRRVIHPELSKGGVCGLCVAASDRVYGPDTLMPIHDRCKCTTTLLYRGQSDAGAQLNRREIRELYSAAGGNTGDQLKRVRVNVVEHGELGPRLVDASHSFRGPAAVAAA